MDRLSYGANFTGIALTEMARLDGGEVGGLARSTRASVSKRFAGSDLGEKHDLNDGTLVDSGVELDSRVFIPSYLGGDLSFAEQTEEVYSDPDLLPGTMATELQTSCDLEVAYGIESSSGYVEIDRNNSTSLPIDLGNEPLRVCYVHLVSNEGGRNYVPHDLNCFLQGSKLFVTPGGEDRFQLGTYKILVGYKRVGSSGGLLDLKGNEHVLALGIGNGRTDVPMMIANPGLKVTMVDMMPDYLAEAQDFYYTMVSLQPDSVSDTYTIPNVVQADFMSADFVNRGSISGRKYDLINLGLMRTVLHSLNARNFRKYLQNLSSLLRPGGKVFFDVPLVDSDPDHTNWMYQILFERHRDAMKDPRWRAILVDKLEEFVDDHGFGRSKTGEDPNGLIYDIPGNGQLGQTRGTFDLNHLKSIFEAAGFPEESMKMKTISVPLSDDQIHAFLGANSIGTSEDRIALEILIRSYLITDGDSLDDNMLYNKYKRLFNRALDQGVDFREVAAFMDAEFYVSDELIEKLFSDKMFRITYFVFEKASA